MFDPLAEVGLDDLRGFEMFTSWIDAFPLPSTLPEIRLRVNKRRELFTLVNPLGVNEEAPRS